MDVVYVVKTRIYRCTRDPIEEYRFASFTRITLHSLESHSMPKCTRI